MKIARGLFAVLLIGALTGAAARAGERSEVLYSKGLVQFHQGHYDRALELFDQAIAANPEDPDAHYYRGVTRARRGDFAGALADLRVTVEARPGFAQAALDLGIALTELGRFKEAIPSLRRAAANDSLAADAAFYLGLAELRLNQLDRARASFQRAAALNDKWSTAVHYYLGVVEMHAGNAAAAREQLGRVVEEKPSSPMAAEAKSLLDALGGRERRPYEIRAGIGFQYDSNVALAPDNEVLKAQSGISDQSDGRVTLDASVVYVPWRTDRVQLSLGYEFFQSLHFELDRFNLQNHRPTLQLAADLGYLSGGIALEYDYFLLRADSFLQQGDVVPWLAFPEGDLGRTEIYYRMRRNDFLLQPFEGVRDAFNHAVGGRQIFYLGDRNRYVTIGYRFDTEDPIEGTALAQSFAYDGHQAEAGLGWALPHGVSAELSYAYRHEDYAPQSGGRRDDENLVVAALRKRLGETWAVTLGYLGDINDSTDPSFQYRRHIGSVSLEARY